MRNPLLILLLALAGCAPVDQAKTTKSVIPARTVLDKTNESGVYANAGRPVVWPADTLPITFAFAADTPPALRRACRRAGQTFSVAAGRTLFVFSERAAPPLADLDQASGVNMITYGQRASTDVSEVGLAKIFYRGNRIVEGNIDFVPGRLNLGTVVAMADPEASCLHELGHILGFAHRSDPSSIMYPFEVSHLRTLSIGDRARLLKHYGG